MWSLRGAQRRDLRFDGQDDEWCLVYEDCMDQKFGGYGGVDERSLPPIRSPVYPPRSFINDQFSFGLPLDSTDHTAGGRESCGAMAESDLFIDRATLDGTGRSDAGSRDSESDSDFDMESDSDLSDDGDAAGAYVYGSPWKTSAVTVSRKAVEKYEKKKLAQRLYSLTMRDFKAFHLALSFPPGQIAAAVVHYLGKPLVLRYPENWYLIPQRRSEIRVLRGVDLSKYLCCGDTAGDLTPLGVCAARSPDLHFRETPCALIMDERGRFFLYDAESDGLYYAARNIDQLARRGLSLCEPVYRDGGAVVSMPKPKTLVRKIVSAAVVGLENVAATATAFRGSTIALRDPVSGRRETFQVFGASDLKRKPPFSRMDDTTYTLVREYITFRLAEAWTVIGAVGEYRDDGFVFEVSTVVLVGARGTVYGFCLLSNDVFRIAEDISVFFKRGGVSGAAVPNRFDRGARGELRLERPPLCPHRDEDRPPIATSLASQEIARRDLEDWYRWRLGARSRLHDGVALSNVSEAKRQLTHPAKGIPVSIVTAESYHPRGDPEEAFESLSGQTRPYRYPRVCDASLSCSDRDFYRRYVRAMDMFDGGKERSEREIMFIRAERVGSLQKTGTPLKLPPLVRATQAGSTSNNMETGSDR
ncbi:m139 protein [Murid betaherpesvirus 1]|nr:m139 protein [Murid betaherpesvirus 1]AWV68392.1 m139 protein [Murid betaherpesvirus 1]